ncbi:FG-GAP-like repeat-containing protein [Nannocystis punicea]|uniref:FG-GAP-like repeat-containing protein n=1 Tax=Nannocystis punicea TaxID=2995304 RepID=A0ABY7H1J8_9BACT|nr:FG-GAP-like repeat-containing protein [Nannocystis poenicansa]WAS93136.1 FG-GAP-like repeat-containing protein [Nannocystis poenicansa]
MHPSSKSPCPWRLTLAVFVLPLAACDSNAAAGDDLPTWEEFREAATRVVDGQPRYVVDGDLPVTLDQLAAAYHDLVAAREGTAPRSIVNLHDGVFDRWPAGQEHELTYCVSDEFGARKARVVQEMAEAARSWEQAAHVDFRYRPAGDAACQPGAGALFAVRPWQTGGAMSFFPAMPESTRTLYIDYPDFDDNPDWRTATPRMTTVGVLRHELGHILGLRHEHTRLQSSVCFEDTSWAELGEYDHRSVMHYPWCTGGVSSSDYTLTIADQEGARTLYGPPAVVHHRPTVAVDFDHDGRSDLGLTGSTAWKAVPLAFAADDRGFSITNLGDASLAAAAGRHGVQTATGDFDGDGRTDLVLAGVSDWKSLVLALSRGDGSFAVSSPELADWHERAARDNAHLFAGDFDGDARDDLALLGAESAGNIAVALAAGDGGFTLAEHPSSEFAAWAAAPGVRTITGDFDGDGTTDLALAGGRGESSVPVALSRGDGSFAVERHPARGFATAAADADAVVLAGDFDGDGTTDLALTGPSGWKALPAALSNGDGSFELVESPIAGLAERAGDSVAHVLPGDFDGDGKTDLALIGHGGDVPLALSRGDGTFAVTDTAPTTLGSRIKAGAQVIAGDFDGDGKSDLAMTGPADWRTLPTAYSNGDGSFTIGNKAAGEFPGLAGHEGAHILE